MLASRPDRDAPGAGGQRRMLAGVFVAVRAAEPIAEAFGGSVEAFAHLNTAVPVVGVRAAATLGGGAGAARRGP